MTRGKLFAASFITILTVLAFLVFWQKLVYAQGAQCSITTYGCTCSCRSGYTGYCICRYNQNSCTLSSNQCYLITTNPTNTTRPNPTNTRPPRGGQDPTPTPVAAKCASALTLQTPTIIKSFVVVYHQHQVAVVVEVIQPILQPQHPVHGQNSKTQALPQLEI